MSREFSIRAMVLSVMIGGIAAMVMAGAGTAEDSTIMLSGHINYEGPGGVFYPPEGANVSARYMGQEYYTRADSNGNFAIGPIPVGSDYTMAFKINYTDPDGNYHVWPMDGWHETLLPVGGKVAQDMILIRSTAPSPTSMPAATPSSSPVPAITPAPMASPSPTPAVTASPSPIQGPTAVPDVTQKPTAKASPSALLSGAAAIVILALFGCLARKKL